jgi:hypothetical protein
MTGNYHFCRKKNMLLIAVFPCIFTIEGESEISGDQYCRKRMLIAGIPRSNQRYEEYQKYQGSTLQKKMMLMAVFSGLFNIKRIIGNFRRSILQKKDVDDSFLRFVNIKSKIGISGDQYCRKNRMSIAVFSSLFNIKRIIGNFGGFGDAGINRILMVGIRLIKIERSIRNRRGCNIGERQVLVG